MIDLHNIIFFDLTWRKITFESINVNHIITPCDTCLSEGKVLVTSPATFPIIQKHNVRSLHTTLSAVFYSELKEGGWHWPGLHSAMFSEKWTIKVIFQLFHFVHNVYDLYMVTGGLFHYLGIMYMFRFCRYVLWDF